MFLYVIGIVDRFGNAFHTTYNALKRLFLCTIHNKIVCLYRYRIRSKNKNLNKKIFVVFCIIIPIPLSTESQYVWACSSKDKIFKANTHINIHTNAKLLCYYYISPYYILHKHVWNIFLRFRSCIFFAVITKKSVNLSVPGNARNSSLKIRNLVLKPNNLHPQLAVFDYIVSTMATLTFTPPPPWNVNNIIFTIIRSI